MRKTFFLFMLLGLFLFHDSYSIFCQTCQDTVFLKTINLLEKNSDYIIENRGAISEIIGERVIRIIFDTSDSIIDINDKLDIFFLTFIHHHDSFYRVTANIIDKFKNDQYIYSVNGNYKLIYLIPAILVYPDNKSSLKKLRNEFLKIEISPYIKSLNFQYTKLFESIYLYFKNGEIDFSIFALRKLVSPQFLTYLNDKYKGFKKYPINLNPITSKSR